MNASCAGSKAQGHSIWSAEVGGCLWPDESEGGVAQTLRFSSRLLGLPVKDKAEEKKRLFSTMHIYYVDLACSAFLTEAQTGSRYNTVGG